MRFILNFIFFGILFYAIWFFFPDAFNKMVEWAGAVFTFVKDLVAQVIDKIQNTSSHAPQNPAAPAPGVISLLYWWI